MIQYFPENKIGCDYIVGDIHGCFTLLQEKLDSVSFNPDTDRLFSVGDLVDRGPESEDILDWLAKPWLHPVRGNHDDMAIRWPNGNMDAVNYAQNGGLWNIRNPISVSIAISSVMKRLPHVIELDTPHGTVGIVHAECPFDDWNELRAAIIAHERGELNREARQWLTDELMWARGRITNMNNTAIANIHAVFVGHTPVKQPVALGNSFYIDTGAGKGGKLTLFNVTKWEAHP